METRESLLSKKYSWGKISVIHEIGPYLIVEYYENKSDGNCGFIKGEFEPYTVFQPFVNGHDTSCAFSTLDRALIHAICVNSGHRMASEFINNMLAYKYQTQ